VLANYVIKCAGAFVSREQGDQIRRIFAYWAIFFFDQFFELRFSIEKVTNYFWQKQVGPLFGQFFHILIRSPCQRVAQHISVCARAGQHDNALNKFATFLPKCAAGFDPIVFYNSMYVHAPITGEIKCTLHLKIFGKLSFYWLIIYITFLNIIFVTHPAVHVYNLKLSRNEKCCLTSYYVFQIAKLFIYQTC
jgi:hypothetical protein